MSAILIVDDYEQNRYLLRAILTASGHEVLEAANGAEALELARRTRPDLIISDILMPQMDGFALCRECKRDEQLRDIPFVFYTATYTDPRDEALALQLGAARFIVKPVESEAFIAIVREVLQAHAAGQLAAPPPPLEEETAFYRLYNEALILKLEDKMLDLERLNRRLAESEERYRRLAENAPDLIYRYELAPQRGFTYVSPAATVVTGYTPEEHYADPDLGLRLVHPDDRPLLEAAMRGETAPGQPLTLRWVHKDGHIIWTEQRIVPFLNEAGELFAIEGIARDITEPKRAEDSLRNALAWQEAISEGSRDAIFITDADSRITSVNSAACQLTGYSKQELLTMRIPDLHEEVDLKAYRTYHDRIMAGEEILSEAEILRKDGSKVETEFNNRRIVIEGVPYMHTAARDITERKRAEEALRESEEKYRNLVERANDGIAIIQDGVAKFANHHLAQMWGGPIEEIIGTPFSDFVYPDQVPKIAERYERRMAGEEVPSTYEAVLRRKDGSKFQAELNAGLSIYHGRRANLVVIRDITERKKAEEALAKERNLLRTVIDNLPDNIFVKDAESRFVLDNLAHLHLLGAKAQEEVLGKTDLDIFPEELSRQYYADEQEVIQSGKPLINREELAIDPTGSTQRFLTTKVPLRDAQGRTVGIVGINRDITALKEAEKQIQRRADEFAALYETARDLATLQELPTLLQTIIERAAALVHAASGSIFLYDAARQDLEIVVAQGTELPVGTRFQLGEGMTGRVAQSHKPLAVEDYRSWEHRSPQMGDIPLASSVAIPMLYGGELIGVLVVNEVGDALRRFAEEDVYLLSLFASQAASAVHVTRLLAETSTRAQQLGLLYDAGLALNSVLEPKTQLEFLFQIATKTLHADRAEFFRLRTQDRALVFELGVGHSKEIAKKLDGFTFSTEEPRGLNGWVYQNRTPLNVPDVLADPRYLRLDPDVRSGLWVPVEHENQLRGVLSVLSTSPNAFTPQDERLLMLFANQAAVALENARLFEETRQRLAELEAINRVSTALREAQTLDEMLPRLLDETLSVLGTPAGTIWLVPPAGEHKTKEIARGWFEQVNEYPPEGEEGLAFYVLKTGQPYFTSDLKTDPYVRNSVREAIPEHWSGACIPLRASNETVGALFVGVPSPRLLNDHEIHMLMTLAEIAGNTIQRMRCTNRPRDRCAISPPFTLSTWRSPQASTSNSASTSSSSR